MPATFPHTTIYSLTHAGRTFFYFFVDGIETALTAVEFSRLAAAGARIVEIA